MRTIQTAALLGAVAVVLGAFGAHALAERLTAKALGNWDTATEYQFYHVLALFGLGILQLQQKGAAKLLRWAAWAWVAGLSLFSGSIYLLSLREIAPALQPLTPVLGPLTPLGGLLLIVGWLLLFAALWRQERQASE